MNSSLKTLSSDWLAAIIRWLFMALIPLMAGLADFDNRQFVAILSGWIAFSLFVSLMRLASWRPNVLDDASMVIDTLLGLGLIGVTGWHVSPFWWSLLLPAGQSGLQRDLRSGGIVLLGGLMAASLLSMGANQFNLWVLAESLLQGSAVGLGGLVMSVPARGLLHGARTWRRQGQEANLRGRTQERIIAGQISLLSSEINATLDAAQVASQGLALCNRLLDDAMQSDGQHTGAVYLYQDEELNCAASTLEGVSHLFEGVIQSEDIVVTGASILQDDEMDQHGLRQIVPVEDWCECIMVPLMAGPLKTGLLIVGHPAPSWFGREELALVEAIGRQMGVALNNARLYAEMVAERDRISEIQEEVRKKLARDLHDGPTQVVAAIAMRVNFARRLLGRDREKAAGELLKVEQMARRTTQEIRHMLFTLRPLILESQGLVAALNQLVDKTIETHNQLVYLELDPDLKNDLGLERESVLFFIAEEAINNARKHAAAAHIWVRLMNEDEWFILEVEDDGAGFNVGEVDRDYEQRGSLGMVNMRERAELVNGELYIESTEGVGTLVRLKVPMVDPGYEPDRYSTRHLNPDKEDV